VGGEVHETEMVEISSMETEDGSDHMEMVEISSMETEMVEISSMETEDEAAGRQEMGRQGGRR
jgi:hypothetical protein